MLELIPNFILASGSPRRRELLEDAGFGFDSISVDVDESIKPGLSPLEIVDDLALRKLTACKEFSDKNLVLTADTLVFQQDHILGKPIDRKDAIRMLKLLSNTYHTVTTSVCFGYKDFKHQFNVSTKVYFTELSLQTIAYYIDHYQPFDKAGSYGIQEWIGEIGIYKIEGSYTNVVGLPMTETYQTIVHLIDKWMIK